MSHQSAPHRAIDSSILVTTFRRPGHLALVLESIALQRRVPRGQHPRRRHGHPVRGRVAHGRGCGGCGGRV